jgi:type IV fimbrial biogenesis protein FimT
MFARTAHTSRRHEPGFTIVELMAVIAIATILVAIGVPSFRSITSSSRMSTEVNGLLADIQFARSEALKEGRSVTACISTDSATCTGGAQWQGGWIVFSDPNANATVDTGDTVLRVQKRFSGTDAFQEPNGLNAVTFNRSGFALNLPNAGVLLTLHDRVSNSAYTRCLSIALAGMAATQTHTSAPGTCT